MILWRLLDDDSGKQDEEDETVNYCDQYRQLLEEDDTAIFKQCLTFIYL